MSGTETTLPFPPDEPVPALALAYRDAEERKAEREAEAQRRAEEAALAAVAFHVYDPRPYPEAVPSDESLYEGTSIGALYGFAGCEHVGLELGDWTIGKEPR